MLFENEEKRPTKIGKYDIDCIDCKKFRNSSNVHEIPNIVHKCFLKNGF